VCVREREGVVAVESVAVLLFVQKVQDSNFSLDPGYPDCFPSVTPDSYVKSDRDRFLLHAFQFVIH
jgi:hypothetical protein